MGRFYGSGHQLGDFPYPPQRKVPTAVIFPHGYKAGQPLCLTSVLRGFELSFVDPNHDDVYKSSHQLAAEKIKENIERTKQAIEKKKIECNKLAVECSKYLNYFGKITPSVSFVPDHEPLNLPGSCDIPSYRTVSPPNTIPQPTPVPSLKTNDQSMLASPLKKDYQGHLFPITIVSQPTTVPPPIVARAKFQFNPLMFKEISVIKEPSIFELEPKKVSLFELVLKLHILRLIDENSTNASNANYAVILRMAPYFENMDEYFDRVPNSVKILFNSRPLLEDTKDSELDFYEAPLDVTNYCWPQNKVRLLLQSTNSLKLVVGVYFVQLLKPDESIIAFTDQRFTRESVARMLQIAIGNNDSVRVPIDCPVSKERIAIPCVGNRCQHLECFDLLSFLTSNTDKLFWKCPICKSVMRSVLKDELFANLLPLVSRSCKEVEFFKNGEWKEVVETLIEDVEVEIVKEVENCEIQIVDLTIDSDDDESVHAGIIDEIFIERVESFS